MKQKELERKAHLLRLLANPVRLGILSCMLENPDCTFKDLQQATEKSQSTISQHITLLKTAGIVDCERVGTKIKCFIVEETFRAIISLVIQDNFVTNERKEIHK